MSFSRSARTLVNSSVRRDANLGMNIDGVHIGAHGSAIFAHPFGFIVIGGAVEHLAFIPADGPAMLGIVGVNAPIIAMRWPLEGTGLADPKKRVTAFPVRALIEQDTVGWIHVEGEDPVAPSILRVLAGVCINQGWLRLDDPSSLSFGPGEQCTDHGSGHYQWRDLHRALTSWHFLKHCNVFLLIASGRCALKHAPGGSRPVGVTAVKGE
jgi:hypothetical protein